MKLLAVFWIHFFVAIPLLLTSCASGPSAHQIIGSQLASPNVTFSELNQTLSNKGYMNMKVKKRIGPYSLVEFANWEIVFEDENVVFADRLANGKDAEAWVDDKISNSVQAKSEEKQSNQRIIIIE